MKRILLPALVAGVLVVAGCGGDDDSSSSGGAYGGSSSAKQTTTTAAAPASGAKEVSMVGTSFQPAKITVKAGQKITWKNDSDLPHNVTATSGATFKSDTFNRGGTFAFTPKKAGTISYVCTIHPGMQGTITVTG
ncbi:MAG: cupredoxin domain-containing protein [Solirubrobacterales bacterium]|nr:cupredoxin domain-containing protein [Solirubrobacterales bacterium]